MASSPAGGPPAPAAAGRLALWAPRNGVHPWHQRIWNYGRIISRNPIATGGALFGIAASLTTIAPTFVGVFGAIAFTVGSVTDALQTVRADVVKYRRRHHPDHRDGRAQLRDEAGLETALREPKGLMERVLARTAIGRMTNASASLVSVGAGLATGNFSQVLVSGLFLGGNAVVTTSVLRDARREGQRLVEGREKKLETEENRALKLLKRLELNPLLQRWNQVPTIGWLQHQVRRFDNMVASVGTIIADPVNFGRLAFGTAFGMIAMAAAAGPVGVAAGALCVGGAVVQGVVSKRDQIRRIWVPGAETDASVPETIAGHPPGTLRDALDLRRSSGWQRQAKSMIRGAGGTLLQVAGYAVVAAVATNPLTIIGWAGFAVGAAVQSVGQARTYRKELLAIRMPGEPKRPRAAAGAGAATGPGAEGPAPDPLAASAPLPAPMSAGVAPTEPAPAAAPAAGAEAIVVAPRRLALAAGAPAGVVPTGAALTGVAPAGVTPAGVAPDPALAAAPSVAAPSVVQARPVAVAHRPPSDGAWTRGLAAEGPATGDGPQPAGRPTSAPPPAAAAVSVPPAAQPVRPAAAAISVRPAAAAASIRRAAL